MKILYIEDHPGSIRVMQRTAIHLGHELLLTGNGPDGMALLHDHADISLVLLDIGLPGMDGLTLARLIRHARPDTPIVAITAHAAESDREACLQAGCTDYLSKPFDLPTITAVLKRYA
jgi:CheY-like chemotaxis protein